MAGGWTRPSLVEIGPETAPVVVKLVPESVIEGKITSNGQPAENVYAAAVESMRESAACAIEVVRSAPSK